MFELCLGLDLSEHRFFYVLQEHNLELKLPTTIEQSSQTWLSAYSCRRPPEAYQTPSLCRQCSRAPSPSRLSKPPAAGYLLKASGLALILLNRHIVEPVGCLHERWGVVRGGLGEGNGIQLFAPLVDIEID